MNGSAGFGRDKKELGLSNSDAKAYQDFTTQMERAGRKIETVFVKGLIKLEKPLEKLSDEVVTAPSSAASIRLGSSSPRPDTLTRFETGHMRRMSFGAGRKSSAPAFPVSQASFLERSSMTGMRS